MIGHRLLFVGAVALTFAGSLGPARGLAETLRGAGWLTTFVAIAFVAVAAFVGERLARGTDGETVPVPLLVLTALFAGLLFMSWDLPEERFHLALFPLLGWLGWRAVGPHEHRSLVAVVLLILVGAADEGIQGLNPERQFDWMDVLANGVGGAIVPLLMLGGRAAWSAPAILAITLLLFDPLQAAIGVHPPSPTDESPDDTDPAWLVPTFPPEEPATAEPQRPAASAAYSGHDVLLISIDALRADHVPPYGRAPVATPVLDRLAAESVAVRTMYSPSTWTTPAMVSIFTALHPAAHGVGSRGLEMAPGPVLPLETLAAAGWTIRGHAGDDEETYRNLGIPPKEGELADWLAVEGPLFAWVHLRDVHAPYDATPERLVELGLEVDIPSSPILDRARTHYRVERDRFPGRHGWLKPAIRALYAAEVADADASLGRVLDTLEASGRADRTIVVLTADHGEELLENDGIGHSSTTLDSVPRPELVEVPLLVRFPDGLGAGARRPHDMRHEDLLPSLLPLLGVSHTRLAPDAPLHGQDRSGVLLGAAADPVPTWFVGSPCGWQCPGDRRHERVAALRDADGLWTWCRFSATDPQWNRSCEHARLGQYLFGARTLATQLHTPVASPR